MLGMLTGRQQGRRVCAHMAHWTVLYRTWTSLVPPPSPTASETPRATCVSKSSCCRLTQASEQAWGHGGLPLARARQGFAARGAARQRRGAGQHGLPAARQPAALDNGARGKGKCGVLQPRLNTRCARSRRCRLGSPAALAPACSRSPHPLPGPPSQTLGLHWRRRRYLDFYLFLTGFLLAIVYHVLHMHPEVRGRCFCCHVLAACSTGMQQLAATMVGVMVSRCTAVQERTAPALLASRSMPPPERCATLLLHPFCRASPTPSSWGCLAPPGAALTSSWRRSARCCRRLDAA